jgi:hypothetical protein
MKACRSSSLTGLKITSQKIIKDLINRINDEITIFLENPFDLHITEQ